MAGRCLGELVRKMGDRILSQIVPILKQGMTAEKASTRQVSPPPTLVLLGRNLYL